MQVRGEQGAGSADKEAASLMSDKVAATFHPDPKPYLCENCKQAWATPSAAQDCCGDWLGYD